MWRCTGRAGPVGAGRAESPPITRASAEPGAEAGLAMNCGPTLRILELLSRSRLVLAVPPLREVLRRLVRTPEPSEMTARPLPLALTSWRTAGVAEMLARQLRQLGAAARGPEPLRLVRLVLERLVAVLLAEVQRRYMRQDQLEAAAQPQRPLRVGQAITVARRGQEQPLLLPLAVRARQRSEALVVAWAAASRPETPRLQAPLAVAGGCPEALLERPAHPRPLVTASPETCSVEARAVVAEAAESQPQPQEPEAMAGRAVAVAAVVGVVSPVLPLVAPPVPVVMAHISPSVTSREQRT